MLLTMWMVVLAVAGPATVASEHANLSERRAWPRQAPAQSEFSQAHSSQVDSPVLPGPHATAISQDTVAPALMALERALGVANVKRDKAFFERVEAQEFLFTGSDGSVVTREEDLASLDKPSESTLVSYVPDSMIVRQYGQTAIVWGRTTFSIKTKDGAVITRQNRFTDVFVWRDGRWQMVAGHSSRLPVKQP